MTITKTDIDRLRKRVEHGGTVKLTRAEVNALCDAALLASGKKPRTVVAAAIQRFGLTISVRRPHRHADILRAIASQGMTDLDVCTYGFVMSDGTFATRREAAEAARAAGQITGELKNGGEELTTDDLW